MAEVVTAREASRLGLGELVVADSAGTGAEVGYDIARRARRALERRGYKPHHHRARQFDPAWFYELDLVIALDSGHSRWLRARAPTPELAQRVHLLLSYVTPPREGDLLEVPDPYFSDERAFESCLDLVEIGCAGLLSGLGADIHR